MIAHIISQHSEEAAFLRLLRRRLVRSGQLALRDLARFDERIEAHVDALRIAGDDGWSACENQLAEGGVGEIFAAALLALESQTDVNLSAVVRVAESVNAVSAIVSACGWVAQPLLRGRATAWLSASSVPRRLMGIGACAVHRLAAGRVYRDALTAAEAPVRARALRAIGETAASDVASDCESHLTDDDEACRFWAAWACVLQGSRRQALAALIELASGDSPYAKQALALVLRAAPPGDAHLVLQTLRYRSSDLRLLVWGAGVAGDPQYVPWLTQQMTVPALARIAGEAFAAITGSDLVRERLTSDPVPQIDAGPNDDPNDETVETDQDEGLPWPDFEQCERWWTRNRHRFQTGVRYFMGAVVERAQCVTMLKSGNQRQRIAAAHYLCLLEPGTPLFNTSAPAWRQQRLLVKMG